MTDITVSKAYRDSLSLLSKSYLNDDTYIKNADDRKNFKLTIDTFLSQTEDDKSLKYDEYPGILASPIPVVKEMLKSNGIKADLAPTPGYEQSFHEYQAQITKAETAAKSQAKPAPAKSTTTAEPATPDALPSIPNIDEAKAAPKKPKADTSPAKPPAAKPHHDDKITHIGVGAHRKLAGKFKHDLEASGIPLSKGAELTADDAKEITNKTGIKMEKRQDGAQRFNLEAVNSYIADHKSTSHSRKTSEESHSKTHAEIHDIPEAAKRSLAARAFDTMTHPLRWFHHGNDAQNPQNLAANNRQKEAVSK